jgi:toxin-antitoxin system PIN domain toxin
MILVDVNVLIYAHREQAPDHARYRDWLLDATQGPQPYGYSELVLSGFLRIVTNPRVFADPTPPERAIVFVERLREPSNAIPISPGPRHWAIFIDLCKRANARGNLIPDTYFAALAIESGNEWITTDRDYARFPGLSWRHPLA